MNLTMLGTGHALVTECYNTCFVVNDGGRLLLVDGGGGELILRQLRRAGVDWRSVRDIYVTHKHTDHLLGIIWMVRVICQGMARGGYEGEARIYAHQELTVMIREISEMLLPAKETKSIGSRLQLIPVADGEELNLIGHRTSFFDIHSTKAKQFGFSMDIGGGEKLTCCGDEPFSEPERVYAAGSKWMMHEAFCLHSQAELYKPYEKNHSTVMDSCRLAEELKVRNLILYHTEDDNLAHRKELYTAEGKKYYSGNLLVPDDLETIEL